MSRPCPLCGDTLDVKWRIDSSEPPTTIMMFTCPNCDGHGTIIADVGDVTPIIEED